MSSHLPLVVGFGGYNAAGRSSGHRAYQRLIYDTLSHAGKEAVVASLASLMGCASDDEQAVLDGTLVRRIDDSLFNASAVPRNIAVDAQCSLHAPLSFDLSARQLPVNIPEAWSVESIDSGRKFRVTIAQSEQILVSASSPLSVTTAGQLPSGFDPSAFYRSAHHPRGLSLAVLAASDAINSVGIDWGDIVAAVRPDEISAYCSSAMAQLDQNGNGGLLQARTSGKRVSSKQLAFGFNSMPADFINAYVLGSLGGTGAVAGACATYLYNLRAAVEDIRSGKAKVAVVGVAEAPVLPEIIDGYAAMGALASDEELRKLDGTDQLNHRRASRPFGENCGFTIAESAQYSILMAPELALELGANVYGAVPAVYVNADGYKKSISSPGAGNYLTMARSVGLAKSLVGEDAIRNNSFIQAHGSSTPQNRVTESHIFDVVARAFDIQNWPVAAVKAHLGHSIGAASGDQMAVCLGAFEHGILPGIKHMDKPAADVYDERLAIAVDHVELNDAKVGFLNSKGFGGNNATATVLSPSVAQSYMEKRFSSDQLAEYYRKRTSTLEKIGQYTANADAGELNVEYHFGKDMTDEHAISMTQNELNLPGWEQAVKLDGNEGYVEFGE